jgi:hypothetical protein
MTRDDFGVGPTGGRDIVRAERELRDPAERAAHVTRQLKVSLARGRRLRPRFQRFSRDFVIRTRFIRPDPLPE